MLSRSPSWGRDIDDKGLGCENKYGLPRTALSEARSSLARARVAKGRKWKGVDSPSGRAS